MKHFKRFGQAAFLASACLAWLAPPAWPQYFGRNKVQYEDFDFKLLASPHFQLYYYPPTGEAARYGLRMLERWHSRLGSLFQVDFQEKSPVILYANLADFQQTNVLGGLIGQATGGATEGLRRRVVMPVGGSLQDLNHVLGHELVHVYQFALAQGQAASGLNAPLWFIEGMPEYLSLGRESAQTAIRLRDALLYDRLPDIAGLSLGEYFPYRWGHALWAYLGSRYGDRVVNQLLRRSMRQDYRQAMQEVLGVTLDQLSRDWQAAIRQAYGAAVKSRMAPEKAGRLLELRGDLNVAPALSPDGRTLAILTQRDVFTVDLYLYDLEKKRILRKLSDYRRDQHFEALRFIDSAGAWSPDGRRFAFVAFARGDNRIVIVDSGDGRVLQELDFADLGSVVNPAFSPDGQALAFAGSRGGLLDLYVVNLESRKRRQLTRTPFSELQPHWSPDGRTLAVVTDQGPGTDLDQLAFGKTQIGLVDAAQGGLRLLPLFPDANHINPVFSGDGQSLYFIADREGIPDIYRFAFETATLHQVTRLATGVTGITATAPALTVALQANRLAFSAFQRNGLRIFTLEGPALEGEALPGTGPAVANYAQLPLAEPPTAGQVAAYLDAPADGLPAAVTTPARDYQPQLQLSYLGSLVSTSLATQFENNLVGGVNAQFSDLLENNVLGLGLFLSGGIDTLGGQAAYINQAGRLNWGVNASRVPYINYRLGREFSPEGGEFRDRLVVDQTTLSSGEASLLFPFSQVLRLELGAGFSYYQFDRTIREIVVRDNQVVSEEEFDSPAPSDLGLASLPLALVKDSSYFGLSSPARGERYRLSVAPRFGSLTLYDLLADYRRYFFNIGFTVAFRALHAGHYGPDAEHEQIPQYFVGDGYVVRGYEGYTLDVGRSGDSLSFDNLVGSRLAAANLEFRLPVLGVPGYGLISFPYLPLELAAFADAGVAWGRNTSPRFVFEDISQARVPVISTGLTSRLNLLGALVLEFYYVFPLQNHNSGGHWGFLLGPGW